MRRISVAMSTFDGERFLAAQLRTLAEQTVPPHELVVRDDGSTDGTLDIVDEFASTSPFPVHVERGERRLGFADSFLAAARACTGDAVAFCDQDDVWMPAKLERCGEPLERGDVLAVVHTSRVVDERLVRTGRSYPDVRRSTVVPPLASDPWLAVRGMSLVVDARVVEIAAGRERPPSHYLDSAPMHHDEWLYTVASALGAVAYVAEPLALYRQHDDNLTGAAGGLAARLREAARVGGTYYARRREQALALERLFGELAVARREDELPARARVAAEAMRSLAARLERRVEVYDPAASLRTRARRLARLAGSGGYGRAGFGPSALLRDAAMIALRRTG